MRGIKVRSFFKLMRSMMPVVDDYRYENLFLFK